jgi:hypothetical protein
MSLHVPTVELEVPDDFPQKHYDAVHARVTSSPRGDEARFHYGGAWNAVLYRFVSCARSDETFADSVRIAGSMPYPPQRFIQEDALFGFFVNGLSVIESFFYGLYWIGSMVDTNSFPVVTENKPITPPVVHRQGVKPKIKILKDINVDETVNQYIKIFGTCPLTDAFGRLRYRDSSGNARNTSEYREWKKIRNILAHRAHYGRSISIGGPGGVVWRAHDIQLTDQFTTTRRQWLASTLAELMNGAEIFVVSNL